MTILTKLLSDQRYSEALIFLKNQAQTGSCLHTSIQIGIIEYLADQHDNSIQTLEPLVEDILTSTILDQQKADVFNTLGMAYQHKNKQKSQYYFKQYYHVTDQPFDAIKKICSTIDPTINTMKLYHSLVHPQKKFIISHNAKCGSSFLRHYWLKSILNINLKNESHQNIHHFYGFLLSKRSEFISSNPNILQQPNYKKYIFIRNPWKRLVSCYINKFIQYPINEDLVFFFQKILNQPYSETKKPNLSFHDFVTIIYNAITELNDNLPLLIDTHICPQIHGYESVHFDQIFPLNQLQNGLNAIINEHQLPPIPKDLYQNKSVINSTLTTNVSDWGVAKFNPTNIPNYHYFYTDDLIEKVATIYADDIKRFGFKYED